MTIFYVVVVVGAWRFQSNNAALGDREGIYRLVADDDDARTEQGQCVIDTQ